MPTAPVPAPVTPPDPSVAAASSPLAGDGMWIWYVSKSGGSAKRIAAKAKKRGIEVVYIKSGDAGRNWSQFTPGLVNALNARGHRRLRVAVRLREQPEGRGEGRRLDRRARR